MSHLILSIDDNPSVATMYKVMLVRMPEYELVYVDNAIDGIQKAIELQPDVITLDYMMPSMTGLEALQRLRDHEATLHIPVVIITAKPLDHILRQELDILPGQNEYLQHPVLHHDFIALLKRLIET